MRARDVMTSPPFIVAPGASVRDTARTMLDNHISGLLVVDEGARWSESSRKAI